MSDTAYTKFQHYGTDAQRLAFTPAPPSSGQPIYVWYATDTGLTWIYDTAWHQITSAGTLPAVVQGDLVYGSALNTFTALNKDTNATRYLANTGSSNNPAWAQVAIGTGVSGLGTGVATALGVNVGTAGAPVVLNGALGTPSSGTLTSCTGLPISTGVAGLGTGAATALAINAGTAGSFGAFTKIEEQTPSGVTNISFSSLGSNTHLALYYIARSDTVATSANINLTFNGDTGSNYDRQLVNAAATTVTGGESLGQTSAVIGTIAAASAPAGAIGMGTVQIPDYRGTTFRKMATNAAGRVAADSTGNVHVTNWTIQWRSTAAITSITLTLSAGNFVAGSKFTLYGLN